MANCSVVNGTNSIYAFTPSSSSNTSEWPLPEQVIQWYRASSFALSLDGYNNSAALASNQPASNSSTDYTRLPDTPLPEGLNMTFMNCVNYTIGESVPLMDKPTPILGVQDIIQIVIWGLQALILIGAIIRSMYLKRRKPKETPPDEPRTVTQDASSDDGSSVAGPESRLLTSEAHERS